jgi:ketosteroid isomerase-like protein
MRATDHTLAVITAFLDAFNRHDLEAVMRLMTHDVVFENTSGWRFEGQQAVRGVFTRAFELLSTGWFEAEDAFAAADRCVVRWTYRFPRETPERGPVRGVDVFRVRDRLVAEKLSYVKADEFVRQQLGLQRPRT